MVGEYEVDNLASGVPPSHPVGRGFRVAGTFTLAGEGDERLPERPSAATSPGRPVERQSALEHLAALAVEEHPRRHQVTGGITPCGRIGERLAVGALSLDGLVVQVDGAVGESPFVHQLQVEPEVVGECSSAGADNGWNLKQLVIVDEPGGDGVCR